MRVQNVISNGHSHPKRPAHGKIIDSRTLFGIYPLKIGVRSWSGVDVIGNLSGLKAVVFLWRYGPLCGTQFVGRNRREPPALLRFMKENDNHRHRKNT